SPNYLSMEICFFFGGHNSPFKAFTSIAKQLSTQQVERKKTGHFNIPVAVAAKFIKISFGSTAVAYSYPHRSYRYIRRPSSGTRNTGSRQGNIGTCTGSDSVGHFANHLLAYNSVLLYGLLLHIEQGCFVRN